MDFEIKETTEETVRPLSALELIQEINQLKVKILNSKVAYANQIEAIRDLQNAEMKLIAREKLQEPTNYKASR